MWTLLVFASLLGFVAESSAKGQVTRVDREHVMKPNELLANHMRTVLDRMSALRVTVHPRIRHLYELLRKDLGYGRQGADDLMPPPPPLYSRRGYDNNKLNRIYTTEADF